MRKVYMVERYEQVLRSGTWGSIDCEWEWVTHSRTFSRKEEAEKCFAVVETNADFPLARLIEVEQEKMFDDYGYFYQDVDEMILEEKP